MAHFRSQLGSLAAVLLIAAAGGTHAMGADVADAVVVARNGVLNLRTGDISFVTLPDLLVGDVFPDSVCVVELTGPMTAARRESLALAGVRVLGYLPTNSFLADLSGATPAGLRREVFVSRVVAYRDEWKVAPGLRMAQRAWVEPERVELAGAGMRVVGYWLFAGSATDELAAAVTKVGGRVTSRELVSGTWCVAAHVPEAQVMGLALRREVQFADDAPEFTLRSNASLRAHVQSGSTTLTPFYNRGLHGEGEIVGVIDSRPSITHCSFSDPEGDPPGPYHRKFEAYNTSFGGWQHGTHVAATLAGDGGNSGDTRGVAYAARMVYNIHPNATETSMFGRFDLHASQGARVHSNSWGADGWSAYDGPCRAIDSFQHDQEENLVVHAVSNSSVVYNPENAKNSLAVSSAGGFGNEESMCGGGAGPTADGRRKPEITSVGCAIASASYSSSCGTVPLTGTSMAAPGVSGAAVLLRQYFMEGFYPTGVATAADARVPAGQLLKAMLVNGATDMSGVADFPNTREGWGRVNADNAAYFAGDPRGLTLRDLRNVDSRALETGSEHVLAIEVAEGQSLKVTLAWADAPGEVNATFAPVNDLDLVVKSPGGAVYLGNVFSGGVSVTGGTPDSINNLEQVLVAQPVSGAWTVRVVGSAVNVGPQGYALVITGGVTDVSCVADFDLSGGSDGDDVIAYFGAWDSGGPEADLNHSGGVDGDDIIVFFDRWDLGC